MTSFNVIMTSPRLADPAVAILEAAGCCIHGNCERALPPTHTHLPAGSHACLIACSCGGLVVTSADGAIVCSNTLDDRLRITYSSNLPAVRALLFGGAAA